MKIAVTGSTGLIGSRLANAASRDGDQVQRLGRQYSLQELEGCEAIVHLAGEPVAQRWNAEVKRRIRDSRVAGTRELVDAVSKLPNPPSAFVSASAVGFYGDRGDHILTEQSAPAQDFLAQVCQEWEQETRRAAAYGMRHVSLRFGIVLATEGGALKQMLRPFRMGMGGPVGSGRQWVPWIHIADAVDLILFAVRNQHVKGALNATAPNPVRNSEFARSLGAALSKPAMLPAPEWGLKLLFGEMARVVVASQRAVPEAAQRAGFHFRYPELDGAFADLLTAVS